MVGIRRFRIRRKNKKEKKWVCRMYGFGCQEYGVLNPHVTCNLELET
jgi:hypothetical protein